MRVGPRRTQGAAQGGADGIGELLRLSAECEPALGQVTAAGSDAIFIVDRSLLVCSWSAGASELYGYSSEQILGQSSEVLRVQHLDLELLEDREACLERLLSGRSEREQFDTRHVHKNGSVIDTRVALSPLRNVDGDVIGLVTAARDVTENRRADARLAYLRSHDALTGLINGPRFDEELRAEVIRSRAHRQTAAVLMLDLDNFRYINETFGHRSGDEIVAGLSRALRTALRDTDVMARFDGDEFGVLSAPATQAQAHELAERLLAAVRDYTALVDGVPVRISASIGVVTFGERITTAEELLCDAGSAMHESKETGRDRVTMLTPPGRERTRRELDPTGERLIHDALEQNLFVLHVQPIINLHTGQMTHCEVLLRIADGDSLVMPCEFLPTAERLGLIHLVDRWVIDHAFELVAKHPDLTFEINLSGATIDDNGLADYVVERMLHHKADASRVVFELTETAAVSNITKARELAQLLVDFGCGFAIDDFGAGYSTFYYLKHIPAKYVKIDGEFLSERRDRTDDLVIESIVRIARDLGKETIAEYVSDAARLDLVRALGVDYGQGFHFSKPFPATELDNYPRRRLRVVPGLDSLDQPRSAASES